MNITDCNHFGYNSCRAINPGTYDDCKLNLKILKKDTADATISCCTTHCASLDNYVNILKGKLTQLMFNLTKVLGR